MRINDKKTKLPTAEAIVLTFTNGDTIYIVTRKNADCYNLWLKDNTGYIFKGTKSDPLFKAVE